MDSNVQLVYTLATDVTPLMPKIKPLNKLVNKARDLRAGHKERHRPTGLGFALADSIDYLDAAHWNSVTADQSLFLSRPYLRILEDAGPQTCAALRAGLSRTSASGGGGGASVAVSLRG